MPLRLNKDPHSMLFSANGAGYVEVNGQRYQRNLLVQQEKISVDWSAHNFKQLDEADFELLAACGASVVLLGTGERLRFPAPALQRPLIEAGIGLEVMDIAAVCRTYNILVLEGRAVAAALLFD